MSVVNAQEGTMDKPSWLTARFCVAMLLLGALMLSGKGERGQDAIMRDEFRRTFGRWSPADEAQRRQMQSWMDDQLDLRAVAILEPLRSQLLAAEYRQRLSARYRAEAAYAEYQRAVKLARYFGFETVDGDFLQEKAALKKEHKGVLFC
jgi:hypothetical protein